MSVSSSMCATMMFTRKAWGDVCTALLNLTYNTYIHACTTNSVLTYTRTTCVTRRLLTVSKPTSSSYLGLGREEGKG
ncbi:hypothetical protein F5Y13DRAFT_68307 [Hypoxylon sp. FL1857]|nr:hypothetical protein F5Y13DRAFT_68307 [Hypoxylon sp. FL1857]